MSDDGLDPFGEMPKQVTGRRRAPDMCNYISPRMAKGVRYLDGAEKCGLIARFRNEP